MYPIQSTKPYPEFIQSEFALAWKKRIVFVALSAACSMAAQADTNTLVFLGKDNWLFPAWGSLTKVDMQGIDQSVELIKQIKEALQALDINLELLLQSDKSLIHQDMLPDNIRVSAEVDGRYQTILKKLQASGVSCFDSSIVLKKLKQDDKNVFYRTDQHWTLAAAEASAQATADHIKTQVPSLKGQAGSGKPLGTLSTESRYGDLADIFLTPEQRKQVGRERFSVRKSALNQNLIDEEQAPVHVTGPSLAQPYFGYPQKLSNALDRSVSVNWKPGNIGQWVMLLEYLESDDFKKNHPQVLVWQISEATFANGPNAVGLWNNASLMPAEVWLKRVKAALGSKS